MKTVALKLYFTSNIKGHKGARAEPAALGPVGAGGSGALSSRTSPPGSGIRHGSAGHQNAFVSLADTPALCYFYPLTKDK